MVALCAWRLLERTLLDHHKSMQARSSLNGRIMLQSASSLTPVFAKKNVQQHTQTGPTPLPPHPLTSVLRVTCESILCEVGDSFLHLGPLRSQAPTLNFGGAGVGKLMSACWSSGHYFCKHRPCKHACQSLDHLGRAALGVKPFMPTGLEANILQPPLHA